MNLKTINLFDGTKVCVPDSLNLITSYVIEEQLDWFEDEIKFIRELMLPGQSAIDIGANYGLYTLAIAKKVGQSGSVYAFEPSSATATILSKSVKENGFSQVIVEKKALSNINGEANLSLNDNSELNSLVNESGPNGLSEKVTVTTLDTCMARFCWKNIDFVKIDAEGAEENIINGGLVFLESNSPIIQFEIRDDSWHLSLVNKFKSLGYESYRLIPGLNLLAPWEDNETPDGFLLNLFCCKKDTAIKLSMRGLLIDDSKQSIESIDAINSTLEKMKPSEEGWNNELLNMPYLDFLNNYWRSNLGKFNNDLMQVLNLYSISKTSKSHTDRYFSLKSAFVIIDRLCQKSADYLRLSTLARVARELGYRGTAVEALQMLADNIKQTNRISFGEPFLLSSSDFESIVLDNFEKQLPNLVFGSILHTLEMNDSYSSFYTGKNSLERLDAIKNLGIIDDEIDRRVNLINKRFNLALN